MNRMKKAIFLVWCVMFFCLTLTACGFSRSEDVLDDEKTTVTVTLDANGGVASVLTLVGNAGEPMVLPVPVREGYTFDKWYLDFKMVDQDVFPQKDTTYTARYYANNDANKEIRYDNNQLNQVYHKWYFKINEFTKENQDKLKYVMRNYTQDIEIICSFEGYDGKFILVGSNNRVSNSVAEDPWGGNHVYERIEIKMQTTGSELVNPNNDYFLYLEGIFRVNGWAEFRNMSLTIKYIEKAGTLV